MNHRLAPLVAVLDEEISIYRKLLQLAEEKRNLIGVAEKLPEIGRINQEEAQLAQAVVEAERKRIQIVDDLASQPGSHLATGTLLQLAETVGAPDNEGLLVRRHTLSQLLSELKAETALNRKLLDRELRFINYSLSLMTGADESKQGYSDLGNKQKSASARNLLDWKA